MTYIRSSRALTLGPRYYRHRGRRFASSQSLSDCDELGFSLKPPKKVRKFIKKHKTALLVGAGVLTAGLFAPGAALAVGRGVFAAGKFVGRNAARLLPHRQPGAPPPAPIPGPPPAMPPLDLPPVGQPIPPSSGPVDQGGGGGGGGGMPNYGGGGGGGDTPDSAQADTATPSAKPAISGGIALAGVGLVALLMLSGKKR